MKKKFAEGFEKQSDLNKQENSSFLYPEKLKLQDVWISA